MFFPFYFDWTLILLIPGIIFSVWAQAAVHSTYKKYSDVKSARNVNADVFAQAMLRQNGAGNVRIVSTSGNLSDHFDPRQNVIRLSEGVYGKSSIAAIAIAAHESGHALQYKDEYAPMKVRAAMVPVINAINSLAFPLILIGLLMSFRPLIMIGCIAFFAAFLFQVVTLPVEFDASKRALANIQASGVMVKEEYSGAKKVLRAAAMTYVAAAVVSFLNFLRLFLIARRR